MAAWISEPAQWRELAERLGWVARSAIPIVGPAALGFADILVEDGEVGNLDALRPLADRMAALPSDLLAKEDPAYGLIGYLAVRGIDLVPVTDPTQPRVIDFAERNRMPLLDGWVEHLASEGLLHGTFAERVNGCADCGSARILVRDQCVSCGSSEISEQVILHHFPCACQAPEKTFQAEDGSLRCPKCRRGLDHVSVDYEVSADLCECLACGDITHQPAAGFRCIDCGITGFGQDLVEREILSYALTVAGRALAGIDAPTPLDIRMAAE